MLDQITHVTSPNTSKRGVRGKVNVVPGQNEPRHEKTHILHMRNITTQISYAVTAQLISAFVFATRTVQFIFFLNPKFPASSRILSSSRSVLVWLDLCRPVRKPHCWLPHDAAQMFLLTKTKYRMSMMWQPCR